MAKLLQGAGQDTYTANVQPLYHLWSERMQPGNQGAELEKAGMAGVRAGDTMMREAENTEIRNMQVKSAAMRMNAENLIDTTYKNGGDVGALQQQFQNEYGELGNDTQTQPGLRAAQLFAAHDMTSLTARINAVTAQQFGDQIKAQGQSLVNNLGQLATRDPTQLNNAYQQIDVFGSTFRGKLPPDKLAAVTDNLKQQVTASAVQEMVRRNPTDAQKIVGQYSMLTPQQRESIINYGNEQARTNLVLKDMADTQLRFKQFEDNYKASVGFQTDFEKWLQGGQQGAAPNPMSYPGMDATTLRAARTQITEYSKNPGLAQPVDEPTYDKFSTGIANGSINTFTLDAELKKSNLPLGVQNSLRAQAEAVQRSDPNVAELRSMWSGMATSPQIMPLLMANPGIRGVWEREALNSVLKDEQNGGDPRQNSLNPKSENFVGSMTFFNRVVGAAPTLAQQAGAIVGSSGITQNAATAITSQAEYDKLPPGSPYIWNGRAGTKR